MNVVTSLLFQFIFLFHRFTFLLFFIFFFLVFFFFFFFFSSRRRHTRFDCDWSSDVCSSDLGRRRGAAVSRQPVRFRVRTWRGSVRGGRPPGRRRMPPGAAAGRRSEERRVGKECRSRWAAYH